MRRGWALVLCCTSWLIAGTGLASPQDPPPSLRRAVELINEFKDVEAEQMLRGLLKHPHPAAEQAMAHVQLGLIALNRAHLEEAQAEFRTALLISSIIELPLGSSPKARRLFDQVFRETPAVSAGDLSVAPPMSAAPAPTLVVVTPSEPAAAASASHVASATLGIVGLAVLGTGVAFAVVGENALGQAKSTRDVGQSQSLAQGVGTDWLVADVAYGVAGAAAVAAVVVFFTERAPATSVAVIPTSGGALLSVGGRF